jgi:hypothetical protein
MKSGSAAVFAVVLLGLTLCPAAGAFAQAAAPFPEVPLPQSSTKSKTFANLTLLTGAALIGASFAFENVADEANDDYLLATDADEIERLYDRSKQFDQYSTASLITGEVLLAAGLWMRFLRRPHSERVSFQVRPDRCAVAWRF